MGIARRVLALLVAGPALLAGAYTYDSSFAAQSAWQVNGAAPDGPGNTYWAIPAGTSMIYTGTVTGANPNNYNVMSVVFGGGLMHFLRASSASVQLGVGSYIGVEVEEYGHTSPSQITVTQCVNGTITTLASTSLTVATPAVFLTVIQGTSLRVYLGGIDVLDLTVPLTTGNPGVGSPDGVTAMTWVGHVDTAAPNPVSAESTSLSVLPNDVSMTWQPTTDDPNGIGVARYQIWRNNTLFAYMPSTQTVDYTDATVQPGTSYTYQIYAEDWDANLSTPMTRTLTTPPASSVDPRRTGVRTSGSYWGGGGEQIDTLSGNLNFSLPILTAMQRTGQKFPLSLNYNSQNWRQAGGANWVLGSDTGYGFGWRLQFGSLTPYYAGMLQPVDHYVFTDGTGADYRLDVNTNGVWSSSQSLYVWFDSNAGVMHFSDGSFWVMGCTSGGDEADAGTMYPTILEDANGNQVHMIYRSAANLSLYYQNTSGRLWYIYDFRGGNAQSYSFAYNSDSPVPHLASVTNMLGTAENYAFTYSSAGFGPPFGTDPDFSGATNSFLAQMTVPTSSNPYLFSYDSAGAGELQQVTFPFGGHLGWSYQSFQYAGAQTLREVGTRYLAADSAGAATWTYTMSRDDSGNPNPTVHANFTLVDASGVGAKTWNFFTANISGVSAWQVGLLSSFVQQGAAGGTVLTRDTFTWAQDAANNPYISSKLSAIDEASPNAQTALTTQMLDQYGNVTQAVEYGYNNTTTPIKTYNNTYLYTQNSTSTPYIANYIFNRPLSTTLTLPGNVTKALITNTYDYYGKQGIKLPASGAQLDPNLPVPLSARGLIWTSANPSVTSTIYSLDTGLPYFVQRSDGRTASYSADAATGYSAPMSITTESYSDSVTYNSWIGILQSTGANGETVSMTYDTAGRPATSTSMYGGLTTYTYSSPTTNCVPASACPAGTGQWQQATGPNGVTTTILDGMGRTIRVERGDTSGVQSIVDTLYAPCACSPLGKIQKVSQPYAPGGTPAWTVYTYDGIGRTVNTVQPDGASTTSYSYSGNQTTVTDPADNWKTFTKDAEGNLTSVVEPDPSSGSGGTLTTSYTYDWMNHVSQVSMPRGTTTQTRSFVYSDQGLLTSATNPENGTMYYYYNTDTTLQYKHDAKGQDTVYTYDSAKRVVEIQKYPNGKANAEDTCQRVNYTYGTNAALGNYGRVAQTQYSLCIPGVFEMTFNELYNYIGAGVVAQKTLEMTRDEYTDQYGDYSSFTRSQAVNYTYNGMGAVSSVSYNMALPDNNATELTQCGDYWCPSDTNTPEVLTYQFDTMGRPVSLTDNYATSAYQNNLTTYPLPLGDYIEWAKNAQYDAAGRMMGLQYLTAVSDNGSGGVTQTYTTETMAYNANGQMTSLGFSGGSSGSVTGGITYQYSATQNTGQIQQAVDAISGETIVYQYDALKRLTSAASTPNAGSSVAAWTEGFAYDGFGNMTSKTLNGTGYTIGVNAATNQVSNATYDLNGNMVTGAGVNALTYDVSNRVTSATMASGGIEYYGYSPDNKQVYRMLANGNEEITLFGGHGEKLEVMSPKLYYTYTYAYFQPIRTNLYFAGKMIWSDGAPVFQDRLGTNRMNGARFYPYGDEITSTANDREKFATYTRDSYTGLDYADQRYYASTYGRFNTVDPIGSSANPGNPLSWNRYVYTLGDPINGNDPSGLCDDGDTMADGDYDYSIGVGACPVLSIDDSAPDAGEVYNAAANQTPDISVTVTAKAPTGGFWSWLGGLFSSPSQGVDQTSAPPTSGPTNTVPIILASTTTGPTIGPNMPSTTPQNVTAGCMTASLVNNLLGSDDAAGATVAVNVALYLAWNDLLPAFVPGPSWLYAGVGLVYDAGVVTKSYMDCKNNGGPSQP